MKKPIKPHNVQDIWSMSVTASQMREHIELVEKHLPELNRQLAELQKTINDAIEVKVLAEKWLKDNKNYKDEYMDFDDALQVFVSAWKNYRLGVGDSRIPRDSLEEMRINIEGRFERDVILRACRSTGTTWQVGFADGTWDYSILWFKPKIKIYIMSHARNRELEK